MTKFFEFIKQVNEARNSELKTRQNIEKIFELVFFKNRPTPSILTCTLYTVHCTVHHYSNFVVKTLICTVPKMNLCIKTESVPSATENVWFLGQKYVIAGLVAQSVMLATDML